VAVQAAVEQVAGLAMEQREQQTQVQVAVVLVQLPVTAAQELLL
jgi:hypothetical protein